MPTVTLLTDFGPREGFAAAMKGVILSIAPDADLVDVTHDIPRGDVEARDEGAHREHEEASTQEAPDRPTVGSSAERPAHPSAQLRHLNPPGVRCPTSPVF